MALQKQAVALAFGQGIDTKTDKWQVKGTDSTDPQGRVSRGKLLALSNVVFNQGGLLLKRNGFAALSVLPTGAAATSLTTFNGDLTAIGTSLYAYNSSNQTWLNKGAIQPCELSVLPLVRNSTNQSQADTVVAGNLACTVYTDSVSGVTKYRYAVADTATGQSFINATDIVPTSGSVSGPGRVFNLGNYFVIVFSVTISATPHLQYITINTTTLATTAAVDLTSTYTPSSTVAWDGYVANNNLYLAWNNSATGIKLCYIDSQLTTHAVSTPDTAHNATLVSVTADVTGGTSTIYVSYYSSSTQNGYVLTTNQYTTPILAPTQWITGTALANLTSVAQNGSATLFYEVVNAYSYDSTVASNFIRYRTVSAVGSLGTATVLARSVGLASKAFFINAIPYVLSTYSSSYQPTYFLLNGLTGKVISRLAYQNGGGYLTTGLPTATVTNTSVAIAYLRKDLIASVNKNTNVAIGTQTSGIYSQTGINLATFELNPGPVRSVEIGNNLHLSGGFVWMYDGYVPVEHNFFLYPDNVELTPSGSGGALAQQQYYYQVVYESTDAQGNTHRSAPSIPVTTTTAAGGAVSFNANITAGSPTIVSSSGSISGILVGMYFANANIPATAYVISYTSTTVTFSQPATGSATTSPVTSTSICSVTVNVPTLRLSYRPTNVKAVIYRWSTAQQNYYQVTSITSPLLNDPTIDSVSFVDTTADPIILGNSLLYTTGGVVENISAPATQIMTLFKSRMVVVDSEDPSLLYYSKQVVESTPVEFSDLFTIYAAPTSGAQGSTGPVTALGVLDDKLIIFKSNAIYYLTGNGPDNTGANNDFSEPTFISSVVGCSNPASIVFTPNGLIFDSDKGRWLLGRDLSTSYIGAPVQAYNSQLAAAALNIPGTNQVRLTLPNDVTLMYDYYYDQWGTFTGIPGISATLYQGRHTYVDSLGRVFQETPGTYLDGPNPTLIGFTTAWFNLTGLQGFQRAYFFSLLGEYLSPHKLSITIAYDYNPSITQQVTITPDNYSAPYGVDPIYGVVGPYGGTGSVEQWQVFLARQKCEAFQITVNELFDPSFGTIPGAGLTLSGLNLVIGAKSSYPRLKTTHQVG